MTKWILKCIIFTLAVVLCGGCGNGANPLLTDIDNLKSENTELSLKVESLQQENTQLAGQVNTLSALDKDVRLDSLDTLDEIRIAKRTGLYDKDKDGTRETLVVYIEPLDTTQDFIKAVGTAQVELWDLDADPAAAKLAEWSLTPEQLHPLWGGNIFAGYYRLSFPIANIVTGQAKELTVKVTFTDMLSGKVLGDQTTIKQ
ncbi:MAG: hypothetical protein H8E62_06385 [Planctomycetes bacterium]|nr:hypothetical protein [Planctomycetota bacterium]